MGLRLWEVARATSAAPPFFKAFEHEASKQVYHDGAIYYNNPVKVAYNERKILWPDIAKNEPDILLSIGTGQNLEKVTEELGDDVTTVHQARDHQREIQRQKLKFKELFSLLVSTISRICR